MGRRAATDFTILDAGGERATARRRRTAPAERSASGLVGRRVRERNARNPLISLVVPVFNEEESIDLFLTAIEQALPAAEYALELVFIDDGSRDTTLDVLWRAADRDPRIVVVELSRNFGKEAALTAGLDHASGDVVVPMDVDLQDPPELVPTLLEKWREGFDVVLAVRASRADGALKNASASSFYRLINVISTLQIPADAGDFRLMDQSVVEAIRSLPERTRFMKGLFAWAGFKTATVSYARPARAAGTTKWNYVKLWNFALDGIVSFSTAPLKVWTYIGLLVAAGALCYAIFTAIKTLVLGIDVPGYASLLVVVLVLGATQLISIGVVGEYLGRAFVEAKQRPLYLVRSLHGAEDVRQRRRGKGEPGGADA